MDVTCGELRWKKVRRQKREESVEVEESFLSKERLMEFHLLYYLPPCDLHSPY